MDYTKPEVADFGDLAEMTEALSNGEFTDKTFPEHTPHNEITFSA